MQVQIRRNCVVVYGEGALNKPWILDVEKSSDIEFMTLSNSDWGLKRWLGDKGTHNLKRIVECSLLKLLSARLRAAEEQLVKDRVESNDPMSEQGMLAAISGAKLRKSYRQEFNDLPDAIDVRWPAWTFTDELGHPQERDGYTLKVKTKKVWPANVVKLQIEVSEANLNFLHEVAKSDDVWRAPTADDGDEDEGEAEDNDALQGCRLDHPLPDLPENSPCTWRVQKRQKPCLAITFKSAKKRHDTRYCTPRLVGLPELDQQAVNEAIQSLLSVKERDEVSL